MGLLIETRITFECDCTDCLPEFRHTERFTGKDIAHCMRQAKHHGWSEDENGIFWYAPGHEPDEDEP